MFPVRSEAELRRDTTFRDRLIEKQPHVSSILKYPLKSEEFGKGALAYH
jgi:hypothetical protein